MRKSKGPPPSMCQTACAGGGGSLTISDNSTLLIITKVPLLCFLSLTVHVWAYTLKTMLQKHTIQQACRVLPCKLKYLAINIPENVCLKWIVLYRAPKTYEQISAHKGKSWIRHLFRYLTTVKAVYVQQCAELWQRYRSVPLQIHWSCELVTTFPYRAKLKEKRKRNAM